MYGGREGGEGPVKYAATLQDATVLITGGTGTFGNAFLDECLPQLLEFSSRLSVHEERL